MNPTEPWEEAEEPTISANGSITLSNVDNSAAQNPPSIAEIDFAELLEDSAISLGIYSEDNKLTHAITLWAVEYDADGNLTMKSIALQRRITKSPQSSERRHRSIRRINDQTFYPNL